MLDVRTGSSIRWLVRGKRSGDSLSHRGIDDAIDGLIAGFVFVLWHRLVANVTARPLGWSTRFEFDDPRLGRLPQLVGFGDTAAAAACCFHFRDRLVEFDLGQPEMFGVDGGAPRGLFLFRLTLAFLLLTQLGALECFGKPNNRVPMFFGFSVTLASRHVNDLRCDSA